MEFYALESSAHTHPLAPVPIVKDKRNAVRHRYVSVGAVARPDGRFIANMWVENISVTGLAFRSDQRFTIGDRPLLEVTINGRKRHMRVIVRRTFKSSSARMPYGCGVEYISPTVEMTLEIRDQTEGDLWGRPS